MTRKKIIIILGVVVFGLLYGYHAYALNQFEQAYNDYAEAAAAHDEAALIPMVPENPLRRDLNAALEGVLTGEVSPETRKTRAREGLTLLVLAEGNLDAVGDLGKDVNETILAMEAHTGLALLTADVHARRLIEFAHRRASIVADIRGLSYRANHHTKEIFDRILADGGAMTPAHAAALERLLPEVEEQYNRRSNLSQELGVMTGDVREEFAQYDASW